MRRSAIFLDRDGIVVKPINSEAPTAPIKLQLINEIIPVIKKAKESGYLVIIVSNQPDIALGLINEITKTKLEKRFVKLLSDRGIVMDEIYYCNHHPNSINPKYSKTCVCQKPKPGMLLRAIKKFNINPKNSFMVGDRASDVKAGRLAGIKTILYDPKNTQGNFLKLHKIKPDFYMNSLSEIEQVINEKVAFVLAGGVGSRMMPLTKTTPKPLLKINKIPMIEYILKLLKFHKFSKVGINLFYLKEKFKKYTEKPGLYIVNESHLSGSAGGVKSIGKILKPTSPFLVISSDMLINFDLSDVYKFHLQHKGIATVCCYFRPKNKIDVKKSGLILFDKKTYKIIKFNERPLKEKKIISQWVNSSVYIFNPEVLKLIPNGKIHDISADLIPKILKLKKPIFAYPVNRKKYYQLGIDTPERIKKAKEDIKSGVFKPVF